MDSPLRPTAPPVFLVGAPRSGTSLLYKALCLHPGAGYVSNWVRHFPHAPQLSAFNRFARRFPGARSQSWFSNSNAYVYGANSRSLSKRLFPAPAEGEPFFTACGVNTDPPFSVADTHERLRKAVGRVMRYGGGKVFVNKRIANNRRIPLLVEAFPQARFVNIVRDGRAVAASLSKVDWWHDSLVWWYGGTPRHWEADGGHPWDVCARNWVEELAVVQSGLTAAAPGAVMHLRYEDLVAAPIESFRRVADFAGLNGAPNWEHHLSALRIEETDSWRRTLSGEELKRIESIQADDLELHGYVLEAYER